MVTRWSATPRATKMRPTPSLMVLCSSIQGLQPSNTKSNNWELRKRKERSSMVILYPRLNSKWGRVKMRLTLLLFRTMIQWGLRFQGSLTDQMKLAPLALESSRCNQVVTPVSLLIRKGLVFYQPNPVASRYPAKMLNLCVKVQQREIRLTHKLIL